MIPPKRILFPADFSNRCRGAAHAVRALARRFDAEVLPIHVIQNNSADGGKQRDRLCQAMQRLATEELEGCRVSPCITPGDPAVSIVEHAKLANCDLIMMPTHGFGVFRRFLLGSVTAKVLHDAECPVWTSAHMEDWPRMEATSLRNLVCGIDFGPRSAGALRCAMQSAKEFGAKVNIAYVLAPFGLTSAECREQMVAAAQQKIERILKELDFPAGIHILDGSPATALSEAAEGLNADVLVIGRTHVPEANSLGANAYAIIAHSPCPVLSV